jgi:hypothetical protein
MREERTDLEDTMQRIVDYYDENDEDYSRLTPYLVSDLQKFIHYYHEMKKDNKDLQTKLSNKEAIIEEARNLINIHCAVVIVDDHFKQYLDYRGLNREQVKELVDILDKEVK